MSGPRLLVALSATRADFAYQRRQSAPLGARETYACTDFETLWDAICHHLWRHQLPPPTQCTIALPQLPTQGDEVRPPYWPWRFSQRGLRSALGLERLQLVSDWTMEHAEPRAPAATRGMRAEPECAGLLGR